MIRITFLKLNVVKIKKTNVCEFQSSFYVYNVSLDFLDILVALREKKFCFCIFRMSILKT